MSDQPTAVLVTWALAAATLAAFAYMVRPAIDSRRWSFAFDTSQQGLMMSGFSVILMAMLFPVDLLPAAIFMIIVHEYGHVLAYRLGGHRAPTFQLAPFGGIAFSHEGKNSYAESAYVSLMGPGLSIALLIPTLLASKLMFSYSVEAGSYLYRSAWMVAWLNALNMLPFFPMDGGQALSAIARTISRRAAYLAAAGMSMLLGVYGVTQDYMFFLIFAVLGFAVATRQYRTRDHTPPMKSPTAVLALFAYLAVLATHVFAIYLLHGDLNSLF